MFGSPVSYPLVLLLVAGGPRATTPPPAAPPGTTVLARVNGEAITLDDFLRTLASVHTGMEPEGLQRPQQDPQALFERLITVKLVAQEARKMGLDELPAFRAEAVAFRRTTLADMALQRTAELVAGPDPQLVERRHKTLAGEAKLDSVLFEHEQAAQAFVARIGAGEPFDKVVEELVAAGRASGGLATGYTSLDTVVPDVLHAVLALGPGETSAPIPVEGGFTVVRLIDLRLREAADARRRAEREALEAARLRAIRRRVDELRKKYARVDEKLLEALDFEAREPGLPALRADTRPVVAIEGGEPIRVADLAAALDRRLFHGADRAAESRQLNQRKHEVLDDLIVNRVAVVEATRLGVDRSKEFRAVLREFEEGALFRAAVGRVILPEIRVEEAEIARYYEEHRSDYLAPETMRVESLAFSERRDAEQALDRLRRGADWQWTREHAPGQVPAEAAAGVMVLGGGAVAITALPAEVQEIVRGAASGEYRLYAPERGPSYVLWIREVAPRQPLELGAVGPRIEATLREERAQAALAEWVSRLREASHVRVLVSQQDLERFLRQRRGGGS